MARRVVFTIVLLVIVAWTVDVGDVLARVGRMSPQWIAAAVLISVVQVAVSAWRWRFTAARLGLTLPMATAVREYYRATLLNQVLPGGVWGDVSRAWRHAQAEEPDETGPVVRAVVIERASGQLVMMFVALASVASLLEIWRAPVLVIVTGSLLVLAGGWALLSWGRRWEAVPHTRMGRIVRDARVALLSADAFVVQVLSSLVVVGSYLATFLVAARAVQVDSAWLVLLPLVAPVLMTMLLPVTIAGWGVREGAAAALWRGVGLTPAEGVAVSIAYGLLVLVGSLPGIVVVLRAAPVPGRAR